MASSIAIDDPRYWEQIKQKLLKSVNQGDPLSIKTTFEKQLEDWKDVPLYIAVTGRSGVGKSAFINAIRDLSDDDEGAAETGAIETTMEAKEYPHPLNKQLIICDVPGVGTETFSRDKYFTDSRIGFDRFDMYLILTADRLHEDDLWLAKGVEERGKKFIFVRTKMAQDVRNQSNKAAYKNNPEAIRGLIHKIRSELEETLEKHFPGRVKEQPVFLIDRYEKENKMYDFEPLVCQVIDNFPAFKRDPFIMSMTALTTAVIDAKAEVLKERALKLGVLSAVCAIVPIPGFSLSIDASLILKEALFYREQFGLTEDLLQEVKAEVGDVFKSEKIQLTAAGILAYCGGLLGSKINQKIFSMAIPILGSVFAATSSSTSTIFALKEILAMMVSDAKK